MAWLTNCRCFEWNSILCPSLSASGSVLLLYVLTVFCNIDGRVVVSPLGVEEELTETWRVVEEDRHVRTCGPMGLPLRKPVVLARLSRS
ncbi:Os09g0491238 [Oryza sativa Japonica Group]|uniref:Os09g0491238 protein n=1 Tax=Oryza sativa subsp. japonica TaxID=39947 RepID=A0A0N7KR12_ORYSJ|nr:hypothetical protein EE612_048657 [Oryza sativa]BAT08730.1 Os09g0491238 [Oryza sativa Japonica Group]